MMFNAPMSQNRAMYLIKTLGLLPGQTVVDFGCGEGAFLQLLASETPIKGVGIDSDETLIQKAQASWNQTSRDSTLQFIVKDVNVYTMDMKPVDGAAV
jgi:cyclopropane fatty-acyl-phospholipid synthase-like methyltransferase